ncbi:hypothetical protein PR048_003686 [Dryococelus australis]|uniref:Uncharacterized protein n=1 Tax=Dryococelus australis TaxID=614101 RepID=A0ABQ9IPP4_9NEOP|nr:hypothetical protein PR048_003686 [Dryococelus australis]
MEQSRNARAWETGDPRENPPTGAIVRDGSHVPKLGVTPRGEIEHGSPRCRSSALAAAPPRPPSREREVKCLIVAKTTAIVLPADLFTKLMCGTLAYNMETDYFVLLSSLSVGYKTSPAEEGSAGLPLLRRMWTISVYNCTQQCTGLRDEQFDGGHLWSIGSGNYRKSAAVGPALIDLLAERLARSPPAKAIQVQCPAGSLPDFRVWESCRDDAGGSVVFLGDLQFLLPFYSGAAPYLPQSHSSALKTSMLRAVQISSVHFQSHYRLTLRPSSLPKLRAGGVLGPLYHPYGCSSCISLRAEEVSLTRPQRTHSPEVRTPCTSRCKTLKAEVAKYCSIRRCARFWFLYQGVTDRRRRVANVSKSEKKVQRSKLNNSPSTGNYWPVEQLLRKYLQFHHGHWVESVKLSSLFCRPHVAARTLSAGLLRSNR